MPGGRALLWIDEHARLDLPCCRSDVWRLRFSRRQEMNDGLAGENQIIGDNPSMAAPPYGFRAHDRAWCCFTQADEFLQSRAKRVAHRVVGIIPETLIFPEAVRRSFA